MRIVRVQAIGSLQGRDWGWKEGRSGRVGFGLGVVAVWGSVVLKAGCEGVGGGE